MILNRILNYNTLHTIGLSPWFLGPQKITTDPTRCNKEERPYRDKRERQYSFSMTESQNMVKDDKAFFSFHN